MQAGRLRSQVTALPGRLRSKGRERREDPALYSRAMVKGASRAGFPGSAGVPPASSQNLAEGARWHSRGYLPHFEGGEIPQIVTFRLADSFPRQRLEQWRQELASLPEKQASAELRKRIEACLDPGIGHCWLRDSRVAEVVERALLYFDGSRYRLHAWVIMPNHVHVLLTPRRDYMLSSILHNWKSFTAKEGNRILFEEGRLLAAGVV